ncbi:MAG: 3-keto-5-aminohexanoate cleavage protein [Hyphomicrobiales bacterium]|nr:3-keto-5-aminohexanoate cleavage protein [Hyphomicrobiales bacterium]
MDHRVIITCALNGVLTDPRQHPVPVTPDEMAAEARRAFEAGASVMHIHLRRQGHGQGHLPSWEPELSQAVCAAIRAACPGVIINHTTGTVGPDIEGPLACLAASKPEIAACNAGSLNYLKLKADGHWAWPPMLFDNPVSKIAAYLAVMRQHAITPEFECFDTGIVRSVGMFHDAGMVAPPLLYNFVMGVASGMPADAALLPILKSLALAGNSFAVTAIGRAEIWPLHRACAEAGGNLRSGLEDTFYLPDGSKASSNGAIIEALAKMALVAGRKIAGPGEVRDMLGLGREGGT